MRQKDSAGDSYLFAAELKLRAERRIGELIAERRPTKGGKRHKLQDGTCERRVSLPDGITKATSHRYQKLAGLPQHKFEEQLARGMTKRELATTSGLIKIARSFGGTLAAACARLDCFLLTPRLANGSPRVLLRLGFPFRGGSSFSSSPSRTVARTSISAMCFLWS